MKNNYLPTNIVISFLDNMKADHEFTIYFYKVNGEGRNMEARRLHEDSLKDFDADIFTVHDLEKDAPRSFHLDRVTMLKHEDLEIRCGSTVTSS